MSEHVDSASNDRTANNAVRHAYRVLSDEEKAQMVALKDLGAAFIAKCDEIGMHLLQRVPIFASLLRIGLKPACQRLGKWIKLARPFRRRKLGLDHISLQILLDGIARHSGAALDLPDRQTLT